MRSDSISIEIGFAVAKDTAQVVAVLAEAAAWMSAKGTPAWDPSVLTDTFLGPLIARSELLVARADDTIVGTCTLARNDPEFWPDMPAGEAAYLHKLAVKREYAGRVVTPHLVERCGDLARSWRCSRLRLDCHPNLRSVYEILGFVRLDAFYPYGDDFVVERFELPL